MYSGSDILSGVHNRGDSAGLQGDILRDDGRVV